MFDHGSTSRSLDLFRRLFAEQPVGPEDQEDDEHDEGERIPVRAGDISGAVGFDQPDDEPADDRAAHAAETADHGRGERLECDRRAHGGGDVEHRGHQYAGQPAGARADREHERGDPRRADTHEPGGIRILGGSLHLQPGLGLFQKPVEQHHQQGSDHDDRQILGIERDAADIHGLHAEHAGHLVGHGAVDDQVELFDEDRGAHGGDQDRHETARPVLDRLVEHQLENHAGDGGDDHADHERQPPRHAPAQHAGRHEIGADHREVALGEVDHVHRGIDQHEAERDQRIDTADRQTGHGQLYELLHRMSPLAGGPAPALGQAPGPGLLLVIEVDVFHDLHLAVLDLDHVQTVETVAVLVEVVGADYALIALYVVAQPLLDLGRRIAVLTDHLGQHVDRVVYPRGIQIGLLVVFLLVRGGELLGLFIAVVDEPRDRILAVGRVAGELDGDRGGGRRRTDELGVHPHAAELLEHLAFVFGIGHVGCDRVRAGALDVGQIRGVVLGAGGITLIADHVGVVGLECFLQQAVAGCAEGVGVIQDRDLLGLHFVGGVLGHHLGGIVVVGPEAEHPLVAFVGKRRVGATDHGRNLVAADVGQGGLDDGAADRADDGADIGIRSQLLIGGNAGLIAAAVVLDDQLQFLAVHAAVGIDLGDRELGTVDLVMAAERGVAGQIGDHPDLDGAGIGRLDLAGPGRGQRYADNRGAAAECFRGILHDSSPPDGRRQSYRPVVVIVPGCASAPFVGRQSHELAVAPGHALVALVDGQGALAFVFDLIEQCFAVTAGRGLLCDLVIKRAIPAHVVAYAAGRIQVDRLHRPHEAPARTETVLHGLVQIVTAYVAILDQRERLVEQCALQSIDDKARDFALEHDRRLASAFKQLASPRDHARVGPRCGYDLHQPNQRRRIERVRDQAALAVREIFGEVRGRDTRGRAGQNRIRRGGFVERGEYRPLRLDRLGHVLLYVDRAVQRVGQVAGRADAGGDRFRRLVDDGVALQFLERAADVGGCLFERRRLAVVERDLVAGPGENDRPAAPHQPGADDGYLAHDVSLDE